MKKLVYILAEKYKGVDFNVNVMQAFWGPLKG